MNPSVYGKSSSRFNHAFDASLSTFMWHKSWRCLPCRDFWVHSRSLVLSSVIFSFFCSDLSFKFRGVNCWSFWVTTLWRIEFSLFEKKNCLRAFICLSSVCLLCRLKMTVKPLPPSFRGSVNLCTQDRGNFSLKVFEVGFGPIDYPKRICKNRYSEGVNRFNCISGI